MRKKQNVFTLHRHFRTTFKTRNYNRLISYLSNTYVIKISQSLYTGYQVNISILDIKWTSAHFFSFWNGLSITMFWSIFRMCHLKEEGMNKGSPEFLPARQNASLCNIYIIGFSKSSLTGVQGPPDIHEA